MPVWLVRGSEHIAADDRETLARMVGIADAEAAEIVANTDAENAAEDTAEETPTPTNGGGDGGSDGTDDGDDSTTDFSPEDTEGA